MSWGQFDGINCWISVIGEHLFGMDGDHEPVIADDMLPSLWYWARLCWLGGRPGWGVCCVTNMLLLLILLLVLISLLLLILLLIGWLWCSIIGLCWLSGRPGWGVCCIPNIILLLEV